MTDALFVLNQICILVYLGTIIYILVLLFPFIRLFFTAIFFLLKPQKPAAPSDDAEAWPPEDSMNFYDSTQFARKFAQEHSITPLPESYVQYTFTSHYGECDENVITLGLEILQRLCQGRTVLTVITSPSLTAVKKKKNASPSPWVFAHRYHHYLQRVAHNSSFHAPNEHTLAILSRGFHSESYFAYEEIDTAGNSYFQFCLFPAHTEPDSASEAYLLLNRDAYSMHLTLDQYPNELVITCAPDAADPNPLLTVIREVCGQHNILLWPEVNSGA